MASRRQGGGKAEVPRVMGRRQAEAMMPVAPPRGGLPAGYAEALQTIKRRIQEERLRVILSANAAMVLLYWDIGRLILERQERRLGRQGHRSAVAGSARGLPRHEGVFASQPQVHARFWRCLAGAGNRARGSCTNSLVPPHCPAGEVPYAGGTALVRAPECRAGLVPQHPRAPD
jgi:hypothetical protein